jgi:folate-dependent phosphoribosylglycinamide formyltransferase PurN
MGKREMDLQIVIITGDQLRHDYFVDQLNAHFDVRGVVSESVYQPRIEGEPEDISDLRRHFEEREHAERRYFASSEQMTLPHNWLLRVPKGEANSDEVFEWIMSKEPHFLVLYGSGIISERLLKAFDQRTIKMHLGLSPYYRGSATNFWPLVNGEPELVGATIHLGTSDVEPGVILKQVRPKITTEDRNHDIGCKAIIAGIEAMIATIKDYAADKIKPQSQIEGGQLYQQADFNVEAVRQMRRNLDDGMIAAYLAEPERAGKYPIVE